MKFARLGPAGARTARGRRQDATASTLYDLRAADRRHRRRLSWPAAARPRPPTPWPTGDLPELSGADGLRVGAPIARPGAVICIGMNYAAHAAESGSAPPEIRSCSSRPRTPSAGPTTTSRSRRGSDKNDWEVELGVVIGKRASYLASAGGRRGPRRRLRSWPTTCRSATSRSRRPAASGARASALPGFHPARARGWSPPTRSTHGNLRLRSWVNGEPRQDSSTADMIFDVETIVQHLSQYMALEPGDVILTGTPEGVALSGRFPYLQPGDVVELEIEGLGRQRQEFYRAAASAVGQRRPGQART